jgi:hypothetical protein
MPWFYINSTRTRSFTPLIPKSKSFIYNLRYFKIPPALPLDLPTLLSFERIFDTARPIPSALDEEIDILPNISNKPSVESSGTIDKLQEAI